VHTTTNCVDAHQLTVLATRNTLASAANWPQVGERGACPPLPGPWVPHGDIRDNPFSAGRYRPGLSWPGRVLRSGSFAWFVSLGLHAVVFVAFYHVVLREEVRARRLIIPEARLTNPAGRTEPVDQTPLKLSRQAPPITPEFQPSIDEQPVAAFAADEAPSLALPGLDDPVPTSSLTAQVTRLGGGIAPLSSFFGQTGNAYPTQRFHIVLARPRHVEEFSPRRLVPAIARYKKEAMAFLDTVERIPKPGKADPIEAMKRAFAVRPELIYLLSDGDYPDIADDLERELDRLNADRAVCITAIGFDPSPDPRALLERIARRHGGHFRVVEPK